MKLQQVLCRQHLGFMLKNHWKVQGKRVPIDRGVESELKTLGIPIFNVEDVLKEKKTFERVDVVGYFGARPPPMDSTHPLYQAKVCHMYRGHRVLLEGLNQAKLITKTVEIQDGLPVELEQLAAVQHLPEHEKLVKRCIMTSHLFDATQEKLPLIRDAARPSVRFPRVLGITDSRCNHLICTKLLNLCGALSGKLGDTSIVTDELIVFPFEKDEDLVQLEVTADVLLMSRHSLPTYADSPTVEGSQDIPLPDLNPIKCTITLEKDHFYTFRDIHPIALGSAHPNVHTAIIHYNETQVRNLYETPVTENQILGRTLMHSFAIAAAQARQRFGESVTELPQPITIQCIQTDGRLFHFTVFQLNTLDVHGTDGMRNILWMLPRMPLFSQCSYQNGKPTLEGYNADVFNHLLAFCTNSLVW